MALRTEEVRAKVEEYFAKIEVILSSMERTVAAKASGNKGLIRTIEGMKRETSETLDLIRKNAHKAVIEGETRAAPEPKSSPFSKQRRNRRFAGEW